MDFEVPAVLGTADEIRNELLLIQRDKQRLQVPAYLWERYATPECRGGCAKPNPVAVDLGGTHVLDCCAFRDAHEQFTVLRSLEQSLRRALAKAA